MKRRLATILVADVAGYSGLMEADEEGAAARVALGDRAVKQTLIDRLVEAGLPRFATVAEAS